MKNLSTFILLFIFCASIVVSIIFFNPTLTFCDSKSKSKRSFSESEEEKDKKAIVEKMFQLEFKKTYDRNLGYIPRERLTQAEAFANRQLLLQSRAAIPSVTWQERGPNNIGGRTRTMFYDLNDATYKTVFSAGVAGGIWKTTDITAATPVWTPVNDFMNNLAVCSMVQNPTTPQVMYAGTGEGFSNIDAVRGLGIFKSTDGGTTWTQLASTNNSNFYYNQKLVIKDVAGTEYLFAGTRAGLRRSIDGGVTWTKVLGSGVTATSDRIADIELAANGDLYATTGIFQTDGIYKSTNNGSTWSKLTGGLPTTDYERIEIACAPNNSTRIYALYQSASTNACSGIYRSSDSGASWTSLTVPTVTGGNSLASAQAWYDLTCAVDPNNQDRVIVGGLDLAASTNAGTNWTQISSWTGSGGVQFVHADHHAVVYRPGSSTEALFGNDGGIYRSTNASNTNPTFTQRNNSYNVTQYYACAIHPTPGSNYFLGGTQDNGSHRFSTTGINSITTVTGGDGAFTHIDEDEPNIQITSYIYDDYFISTNGMTSYTNIEINSASDLGQFINPTDYDSRSNTLFGADNANTYHFITGVGTSNTVGSRTVNFNGKLVSAVTVSPNTTNKVFFALENGEIVRVDNATATTPTVTNISTGLPATAYFTSIAVQKGDDNHILISASNYGVNSVWETFNGGTTWTSVEGNLPDMPIRWIVFSPTSNDMALAGTELGVWSTDNLNGTSTNWGETNSGLARVRTDMLKVRDCENTIIAATHGRGMFSTASFELPIISFTQASQTTSESPVTTSGCRKYRDITVTLQLNKTASGTADVTVSADPASTATNLYDYEIITPMPVSLLTGGSTQTVTIRIYDDAVVDGTETLILDYSISGATNAVKMCKNYKHTITINDNDYNPELYSQVIWTENFESAGNLNGTNPTNWTGFYGSTSANPNTWGVYNATCNNIITTKTAIILDQNPSYVCGYDINVVSTATIYRTVNATGLSNITVNFDWIGVGEAGYDYGEVVYATGTSGTPTWIVASSELSNSASIQNITVSLPTTLNNTQFRLGWRWKNDNNTGSSPAFAIDNITVKGESPAPIQTAVNNTTTYSEQYVGPNETVHFYDTSGKIMATLKNNNSTILGCIRTEVDRAGTSSAQFWNNTASSYLASKTFKIYPTGSIAGTINYDLSLYYTQAEINGWQTATGQSVSAGSIVEVSGNANSISAVTPANSTTFTINVHSATNTTFSTNDYKITSAGISGFSGFGFGVPGVDLPVTLISFNAYKINDIAQLKWETSSERNNAGFDIEKSKDGQNFYKIGFVAGVNNFNSIRKYNFIDKDINANKQYYRLKQVDNDGKFDYSEVRLLTFDKIKFSVFPNPFSSSISISAFTDVNENVMVSIFNSEGKVVYDKNIEISANQTVHLEENVIQQLSKGIYYIRIANASEILFAEKIVKK